MAPIPALLQLAAPSGAVEAAPMAREEAARLALALFAAVMAGGLAVSIGLLAQLRARPVDWAARAREMARRPWDWNHGAGAAFVILALQAAVQAFVLLFGGGAFEESALMVAQTLVFHWAILLLVALSLVRRRVSLAAAFGWRAGAAPRHAGLALLLYLGAMPLVIFYTWVYRALLLQFGYRQEMQDVLRIVLGERTPALRAYFAAVGIALAPISEELLFRGIGLPLFVRRFGAWRGVALLSLLFAALHFHVPSFVPLLLIGAAFSLAYLYSGSITVPIVMHAVFNAVNLGLMLLLE